MTTLFDGLDADLRLALASQLRDLWTHTSTALEGNTLTVRGVGGNCLLTASTKGGNGYADKDAVLLNEEIALTQHRLFHEMLARQPAPPRCV